MCIVILKNTSKNQISSNLFGVPFGFMIKYKYFKVIISYFWDMNNQIKYPDNLVLTKDKSLHIADSLLLGS